MVTQKMTKFSVVAFAVLTCFVTVATTTVRADYDYGTTDYNMVQINDQKSHNTHETRLYQVFNNHFGDEYYKQTGVKFNNSNDLYNALKVVPTSGQIGIGDGGTVQALYKDAAFNHSVSVLDSMTGATKVEFKYTDWNISSPSDPQAVGSAGSYDLALQASITYSRPVNELSEKEQTMKSGDPYWNSTIYKMVQDINLQESFSFDPSKNDDGLIHMIMFDLSWYYGEPAFMVALEDMYPGTQYGNPDWDFNDGVYVFQSMKPTTEPGGTPEPATALIFGTGLLGLALVRRYRRQTRFAAETQANV